MCRRVKLLCAGFAAVVLLAAVAAGASATHLSISSRSWRTVWRNLELSDNLTTTIVKCEVTLEGSFHSSTVAKVSGTRIAYVTRAAVRNPCVGGTVTIHQEGLPWEVRYREFTGTLPEIDSVVTSFIWVYLEIRERENDCTVLTHPEEPAVVNVYLVRGTHAMNAFTAGLSRIRLVDGSGGFFCEFAEGTLSGSSETPTVLGRETHITVTLI